MMREKYKIDDTISKSTGDIRLWHTEKGFIEINNGTLAISIKLGDQEKGCIFHGHGKLILDTIVETGEGAVGKPIEKELNDPFLMLGDTEKIKQHFSVATKEDFARFGYESQKGFLDRAEDLFSRFFKQGIGNTRQSFSQDHGFVFAFQNQSSKLDILVANGSKLLYTAEDVVFVSNENNVVLKVPDEVVCSNNRKSVILRKGKSVIIKK